jgi:hypothetical protein
MTDENTLFRDRLSKQDPEIGYGIGRSHALDLLSSCGEAVALKFAAALEVTKGREDTFGRRYREGFIAAIGRARDAVE